VSTTSVSSNRPALSSIDPQNLRNRTMVFCAVVRSHCESSWLDCYLKLIRKERHLYQLASAAGVTVASGATVPSSNIPPPVQHVTPRFV
jgi:hypothetical protein